MIKIEEDDGIEFLHFTPANVTICVGNLKREAVEYPPNPPISTTGATVTGGDEMEDTVPVPTVTVGRSKNPIKCELPTQTAAILQSSNSIAPSNVPDAKEVRAGSAQHERRNEESGIHVELQHMLTTFGENDKQSPKQHDNPLLDVQTELREGYEFWAGSSEKENCPRCDMTVASSHCVRRNHYIRYHYDIYFAAAIQPHIIRSDQERWLTINLGKRCTHLNIIPHNASSTCLRSCLHCQEPIFYHTQQFLILHIRQSHQSVFDSMRREYRKLFINRDMDNHSIHRMLMDGLVFTAEQRIDTFPEKISQFSPTVQDDIEIINYNSEMPTAAATAPSTSPVHLPRSRRRINELKSTDHALKKEKSFLQPCEKTSPTVQDDSPNLLQKIDRLRDTEFRNKIKRTHVEPCPRCEELVAATSGSIHFQMHHYDICFGSRDYRGLSDVERWLCTKMGRRARNPGSKSDDRVCVLCSWKDFYYGNREILLYHIQEVHPLKFKEMKVEYEMISSNKNIEDRSIHAILMSSSPCIPQM